jgi:hypothetical protein
MEQRRRASEHDTHESLLTNSSMSVAEKRAESCVRTSVTRALYVTCAQKGSEKHETFQHGEGDSALVREDEITTQKI